MDDPFNKTVAPPPDGGHLYEVRKRRSELVTAQLDFISAHVENR